MNHLKDGKIKLKNAKTDYRWLKKVTKNLLWLANQPGPIFVCDDGILDKELVGWLDVNIWMPWTFRSRFTRSTMPKWVFTVNSYRDTLESTTISEVEVFDETYHVCRELIDIDPRHKWDTIIRSREYSSLMFPAIEFDYVHTLQDLFSKDCVIRFTQLWLDKNFPSLAKKEIVYKSWQLRD